MEALHLRLNERESVADRSSRTWGRRTRGVSLDVTDGAEPRVARRRPAIAPWPVVALVGGLVGAASTWVVICGLFTLGWLAVPDVPWSTAVRTATRLWLMSYFSGGEVGGVSITLTPLGLTLLNAVIIHGIGGFVAGQARAGAEDELSQTQRRSLALSSGATFATVFVLGVLVASFWVQTPGQTARALLGAVGVASCAGLTGAARATQWHPFAALPLWARSLPRAVTVAVLTCWVTGSVVLVLALAGHRDRVRSLHDALGAGALGGVLVLVVQLLWLPNVVLWSMAWALGGGFSLGVGTQITPNVSRSGLLPALPVLGALPANGTASAGHLWWLTSGVIAGTLAALVVLHRRPRARFDETALVGGLAGVLSGLVVTALAMLGGGDLGTVRLVGLGARPAPLAILSCTLMGLSGMVTGLVNGVLRPRIAADDEPSDDVGDDEADEDTTDLHFPPRG